MNNSNLRTECNVNRYRRGHLEVLVIRDHDQPLLKIALRAGGRDLAWYSITDGYHDTDQCIMAPVELYHKHCSELISFLESLSGSGSNGEDYHEFDMWEVNEVRKNAIADLTSNIAQLRSDVRGYKKRLRNGQKLDPRNVSRDGSHRNDQPEDDGCDHSSLVLNWSGVECAYCDEEIPSL